MIERLLRPELLPKAVVRVVIAASVVAAFLVTASLISPEHSAASEVASRRGLDAAAGGRRGAPPADQRTPPPRAETKRGPVSLGTLQGRALSVRIAATADGPRYTVIDSAGAVLATDLAAEDVYRDFPDLSVDTMLCSPLMMAGVEQ